MNKNFNDLGIASPILKAIEKMGFEKPTEVQSKVIPHVLNQEDLIVMSKTGSGKTAVFGIPILQMTDSDIHGPQSLILTPTRELAVQIENDIKQMSEYLSHRALAVYGQHSMALEIQALKKGASIIIGTPGRVYDHIRHGNLKVKQIRFLVLDEADRMLDMGFIDQVFKIIKTLPRDRITLLFSATMPTEIQRICQGYMKNPVTIAIESQTKTVDTINQTYYRINKNEKRTQLHRLLMVERPESCIIFCNTRYAVDQVQSFLLKKGYASQAIHGDIPQAKRLKIMQQFKEGSFHLLVATDVAARGIHIDDLSLVINYDVPLEKDNYVHRIGRTGRAGKGGRAITFATDDDIMSLYEIEEHTGAMISESELPSDSEVDFCKVEAEKWIEEKYKSSVLPSASDTKESQRRESQKKDLQKKEQQKKEPQKKREPLNKDSRTKEPQKKSSQTRNTAVPEKHKDHHEPVRSPMPDQYPRPSKRVEAANAKLSKQNSKNTRTSQNTQTSQGESSKRNKPFFQRVLNKVLGR